MGLNCRLPLRLIVNHRCQNVNARDGAVAADSGPPRSVITTKPHGIGLGLAICRMIVEHHAGTLTAKPAQPSGSIFRVVLPGSRPTAA
jgi:hypothetical protein